VRVTFGNVSTEKRQRYLVATRARCRARSTPPVGCAPAEEAARGSIASAEGGGRSVCLVAPNHLLTNKDSTLPW